MTRVAESLSHERRLEELVCLVKKNKGLEGYDCYIYIQ